LQVSAVYLMHDIGAAMTFLSGVLYLWLQTAITIRTHRYQLSRRVGRVTITLRVLISVAVTLLICLGGGCGHVGGVVVVPDIVSPSW
jgi:hypothetical protein